MGPKKKIELLRHFGSIKNMTGASREEISKVRGIRKKIAEEIYNTLHS
ncbi:MAG: helix-hairpin-helix domain-containing protein [candidate division WOR-3 bacterium]